MEREFALKQWEKEQDLAFQVWAEQFRAGVQGEFKTQELQAKFGYGSVLSGMIAEAIESLTGYEELKGTRWRVLSGLTGNFDIVTLEVETDSLASWDKLRLVVFSVPGFVEAMNAAQEITSQGTQQFLNIEASDRDYT